jgi:hypothetical protein
VIDWSSWICPLTSFVAAERTRRRRASALPRPAIFTVSVSVCRFCFAFARFISRSVAPPRSGKPAATCFAPTAARTKLTPTLTPSREARHSQMHLKVHSSDGLGSAVFPPRGSFTAILCTSKQPSRRATAAGVCLSTHTFTSPTSIERAAALWLSLSTAPPLSRDFQQVTAQAISTQDTSPELA